MSKNFKMLLLLQLRKPILALLESVSRANVMGFLFVGRRLSSVVRRLHLNLCRNYLRTY